MRAFLIIPLFLVLIISVGCAGKRAIEISPPDKPQNIQKTVDPVAERCLQLVTFADNTEASNESPLPGWTLASPASAYNKKSIFDYIDGAAELYFAYDFRGVATAEYQDGETSIIIDVYDMNTPDGAFGIYSLNRYPEANYVEIGNEGILTDTNLDFWKGRYFCRAYSFDISEKYQKAVVNLGSKLALNIKEAGAEPSIIGMLPQNGLVPKSARFFSRKLGMDNIHFVSKDNILNLTSETRGVVAEYQLDDAGFQLFVIEYPSSETAYTAFDAYSSYLEQNAKLLSADETTRGISKTFNMGDKITFIGLKNQNLWGFWDAETPEMAESILQNILPFPR